MKVARALLAGLLALAAGQVLACYTVYDRSGYVVYNDEAAPVDMSRPIHETLPARFPGGQLVFDTRIDCASISTAAPIAAGGGATPPLLTNVRTARSMHVPYTMLAGGIALVRGARVRPGVTVVPAEAFSVAVAQPQRGTVITELREPPVTILESRDGVAISEISRR
jgi:hypothetical protein